MKEKIKAFWASLAGSKAKVFLMALAGFLLATVSTLDRFNVWYVVLVTVAFTGGYAVKNWLLPSDSEGNTANWRDILSGLIIAIDMGLSDLAASLIMGVPFSYHALWVTVIGAISAYFMKTVPAHYTKAK